MQKKYTEIDTKKLNNTVRDEDAIKNARRETDGTQQVTYLFIYKTKRNDMKSQL